MLERDVKDHQGLGAMDKQIAPSGQYEDGEYDEDARVLGAALDSFRYVVCHVWFSCKVSRVTCHDGGIICGVSESVSSPTEVRMVYVLDNAFCLALIREPHFAIQSYRRAKYNALIYKIS